MYRRNLGCGDELGSRGEGKSSGLSQRPVSIAFAIRRRSLSDTQIVLDVGDAGDAFDAVFRPTLVGTARNLAVQCYLARRHRNLDIRSIEIGIVAQAIVHVVQDTFIGSLIASGPLAAEFAFVSPITEIALTFSLSLIHI